MWAQFPQWDVSWVMDHGFFGSGTQHTQHPGALALLAGRRNGRAASNLWSNLTMKSWRTCRHLQKSNSLFLVISTNFDYSLPREASISSLQLDAYAYSASINACDRGSKWLKALHLREQLQQQRLQADQSPKEQNNRNIDVQLYVIVFPHHMKQWCHRMLMFPRSKNVWCQRWDKKEAKHPRVLALQLQVDIACYAASISAVARQRRWPHAMHVMNEIRSACMRPTRPLMLAVLMHERDLTKCFLWRHSDFLTMTDTGVWCIAWLLTKSHEH